MQLDSLVASTIRFLVFVALVYNLKFMGIIAYYFMDKISNTILIPLLFGFYKRIDNFDMVLKTTNIDVFTYIITTKISSIDTIKKQFLRNASHLDFLRCHYVYFAGNLYLKKIEQSRWQ